MLTTFRVQQICASMVLARGAFLPTSQTAGAAPSCCLRPAQLHQSPTSSRHFFNPLTNYQVYSIPTSITSLHIMAGKKRAAPKPGRGKKVRSQRSPNSVMNYANPYARNSSPTHSPHLPHSRTQPLNLLDSMRCIALCWTLRSSWSAYSATFRRNRSLVCRE